MHAPRSTTPRSTAADKLRIRLFAGMADAIGTRSVELAWEGGTASALRSRLAAAFPAIAPLLARSAVAIGDGYVTDDSLVPCGVDVAIIPPVSGG